MGAGLVPEEGKFRFSLNVLRGFGFEGGHLENAGLDENGKVISMPLHRHEISMDHLRVELELDYAFSDRWGVMFRVPFDIKNQEASVDFIEPALEEEKKAMLRNGNIHHRTETYQGLSDLMLLATYDRQTLFREGDSLRISAGTTLPTGKTEENPFELGNKGREHLHIQFGTGTFDPLLEANYSMPLTRKFNLGGYALSRFPMYANRKTYQAPGELTAGLLLGYHLRKRLTLYLGTTVYYQGFAYWDRVKDTNSGLMATSSLFGVGIKAWGDTSLGVELRYPLGQRTLSKGDVFEHGPTLQFRISRAIIR